MSPFDPMAILDEIQRLGSRIRRFALNLLAGEDQHTILPVLFRNIAQNPS